MVLASVCLMAALVMVNPSMVKSRAFTSEMASSNETSTVVALIAVIETTFLWRCVLRADGLNCSFMFH